jgi:tRNA/tmRNA/rRNA uracil-C5-methylase (TrmA/RlmC/RlmD family)
MNKNEKPCKEFEVTIEKLVYGGAGLARHSGKVVFVPFAVPGDRLIVRPVEEKKTFLRAEIIRILEPGNGRVAPVCPHFIKCGGCQWQQLEYPRQVEAKRQILEETFYHRFPETRENPIVMRSCPQPLAYRSRARMKLRGAGSNASVGFFRTGSHTVEDLENCPLFKGSLNEALTSLRQFKIKVDTDPKPQEMDIACSEEEGSWATALTTASADEGVTPLFGNRRREDVILRRKVGDFTYLVTPSVFFQANDFMVLELVSLVQDSARSSGTGRALDLFAGVGLFTLPLAKQFEKVVAVENSLLASQLCSRNAEAAGLGNIKAVCSDVLLWMGSQEKSAGRFDLILLDPPRTGAGQKIMERIAGWAPKSIIYASCDPQTLVRDLTVITRRGYKIGLVEGLDMFPQTYHFETVVKLEKWTTSD